MKRCITDNLYNYLIIHKYTRKCINMHNIQP
nr:MAG TPA: hypothetical protein [Caudoviricetes sp.]